MSGSAPDGSNETGLTLTEGVALGYAAVDSLAKAYGIRLAAIKGPVLEIQKLRGMHHSADIDVWCDPSCLLEMQTLVESINWVPAPDDSTPGVLPHHSITFRHLTWPCELDLHFRYPGFFASDQDVFERLWLRRSDVEIAASTVTSFDVVGNVAVTALHLLANGERSAKALQDLIARASQVLDLEARKDLAILAWETGSADTLAPVLDALDAPRLGRGTTPKSQMARWDLKTRSSDAVSAAGWILAIKEAPPTKVPSILWRALVLTEEEIRFQDPDAAPGRIGLLRARLRRIRQRGIRRFRDALRAMRT